MTDPVAPRPSGTPSLRAVRKWAEARLTAAGIDQPALDARILVQAALGLTRDRLLIMATAALTPAMVDQVGALIDRRAAREPVSRILGRREFWSLEFLLDPATLDPRPDSETVVEAMLAAVGSRDRHLAVLDLGTGSGCLLLALLSEWPRAVGLGVDRDPAAVAAGARNARHLGLDGRARFVEGDWGRAVEQTFDVIVSNPPYIAAGAIDSLQPEVRRFDPRGALDGGADGLDAYRALVPDLKRLLVPGGIAAVEVGAGQAAAVAGLLEATGLQDIAIRSDLGGIERCVVAWTAPGPVASRGIWRP